MRRRGRQSGYRRTGQRLDAHDAASGPNARSPRALNKLRATWESAYRGDSHDRPRLAASGFLDLDLLLLLRHLCRLWQVDVQYALIELRLYLRRIGIKRQGIARLNEP